MEFAVAHELPGRVRFRAASPGFTQQVATDLTGVLLGSDSVEDVRVNPVTGSVLVLFDPAHNGRVISLVTSYSFDATRVHEHMASLSRGVSALSVPDQGAGHGSALALSESGSSGLLRYAAYFVLRPLMPAFFRMAMAVYRALPFLLRGLAALRQGRLNVEVLDAAAIGLSLARGDFRAVGNITLMFAASDYLEQWTREKSRESLALSLVVDVDSVWIKRDGVEHHIPIVDLEPGDVVVVRSGSSIPVDGVVVDGDATVNEASMTGEGIAVARRAGSSVYAGTVVEDGRLDIRVKGVGPETRVNEIVRFIEESESRKAGVESRAEALADRIVPYSFALSALVLLLTRNLSRAASVLLVDYSCAIRLSTPLAVLTAMREGAHNGVLIKGGRYLEALASADVVVFDKTGTLTMARPAVAHVIALNGYARADVLCIAACLEEHFPHPVARAVVRKAEEEGLDHKEEHTEVEYVVAHGISSWLKGKRVLVGSAHFVHEDEGVPACEHQAVIDEWAHKGYSILHLSVDGELVGILCVEDPLRPETPKVVRDLRALGVQRILMLTGDGDTTAAAVAEASGIEEWRARVLPVDKADIIRELQDKGHQVLMVGDGINDSPALSAADVGVSLRDGADLAREVADVVLAGNDLAELVFARDLAQKTLARVGVNFRSIVGLNTGYLGLGLAGRLQPSALALVHNVTTVGVALNAMRPLAVAADSSEEE
jgi:manganese/zinc-transporting P-type ATPase C